MQPANVLVSEGDRTQSNNEPGKYVRLPTSRYLKRRILENRGRKHPCAVGGPIYRALQGTTKTNDNSQLFK